MSRRESCTIRGLRCVNSWGWWMSFVNKSVFYGAEIKDGGSKKGPWDARWFLGRFYQWWWKSRDKRTKESIHRVHPSPWKNSPSECYLRGEENTWDWNSSWKTEEARQMEAKRAAGSSLSAAGSSRVGDEEEVEVVDAIAEFRAPPHHLTMKGAKWTI